MDAKDKILPEIRLNYATDDLIMKERDYGVSIYKIKKGHVRVTQQQGEMEVEIATLGPGELFGEMAFLNKALDTRSASVRAIDDVELEVIHPATLAKEYENMAPILRYITDQTLKRLVQANALYAKLLKKKDLARVKATKDPYTNKREFYRKALDQACMYRPVLSAGKALLEGRITDISVGGMGMTVIARNALNTPHEPGDEFTIHITLPNGREINPVGKIRTVSKSSTPGRLLLGIQFTGLSGDDTKTLGFFMMS